MAMFIIVAAVLAIASVGAIAWPLLARKPGGQGGIESGAVREARLAEIERDLEFGLIDDDAAAEAKREIETAIDASGAAADSTATDKAGNRTRLIVVLVLGAAPIAAAFLYLELGAPHALTEQGRRAAAASATASQSQQMSPEEGAAAIAAMAPDERAQMIEGMVASLAERLSREPEDIEGWRMLARSYAVLGDMTQSANAWREAAGRSDNVEDWRGLAGALLEGRPAGDERVSTELEAVLNKLLAANENDPLALFFLGYADAQKGDENKAAARWEKLRAMLPPGSPLTPKLDELIAGARPQAEKEAAQ